MFYRALFLLPLVAVASQGSDAYCPRALLEGSRLDLRYVRPAQIEVGFRAIEKRMRKLDRLTPQALDDYLARKPIPVIVAPPLIEEPPQDEELALLVAPKIHDRIYATDRHHLAVALLRMEIWVAYYTIDSKLDLKHLQEDEFRRRMVTEGHVRLTNAQGIARPFTGLPERLLDLGDDPYRSLAYYVRKKGGFKKNNSPFSEFDWADFFRTRISLGQSDEEFRAAVLRGVDLARSPEAAHLPGYEAAAEGEPEEAVQSDSSGSAEPESP